MLETSKLTIMDLTTKIGARWCISLLSVLLIVGLTSCDTGLEPPRDTILSGTVSFVGGADAWPSGDSLYDMRVVAFTQYPPENVAVDVIQGRAWFTADSLPYRVAATNWSIQLPDPPPAHIKYLVVAQQFGPNPLLEWRAIGVYALPNDRDNPLEIGVQAGVEYGDLDILVDFSDLPPQPF